MHVDAGDWRDIGAPAHYLAANLDLAFGRFPRGRFAALGLGAAISPAATVVGRAVDSVVGAGATVPAAASVTRSVVLDGTVLAAGEHLNYAIAAGPLRLRV